MRQLPSLSAIRTFEAAGRLLSFTLAAKELYVTQSAVSRQIRTLEEQLQTPLFVRHTRVVVLTEAGTAFHRAVSQGLATIELAAIDVRRRQRASVLTISCLPTLAVKWLMPRLAQFNGTNPGDEVRLATSIQPAAFDPNELQFAIRVGSPKPPRGAGGRPRIDLTMTRQIEGIAYDYLFPDVLVPVCSPKIGNAITGRHALRDLARQTLIHNTTRAQAWPDWLRYQGIETLRPATELSFGHFFMAMQAAIEDRGVALVPHVLVLDELQRGTLVIPVDRPVESAGSYYLLYLKEQLERQEMATMREWIIAEAARTVAAVGGPGGGGR